jgi:hypothetical protein
MTTLHEIQLELQDLSCNLNYATKQDKHLSADMQKKIDVALLDIEQILGFLPTYSQLDQDAIKDNLIQAMANDVARSKKITEILDLLDGLELLMTQISLMQAAEPAFAYKETIQPYNQI